MSEPAASASPGASHEPPTPRRWRWMRRGIVTLLILGLILVAVRAALPSAVRWYVNRTLDQSPLYDGRIDGVELHLYRGAYAISGVRIIQTSGNVPVPLFAAERVDLALEWEALLSGRLVGRVSLDRPELNFVDAQSTSGEEADDQTGAGGPWLEIIRELFPFKINSVTVHDGSIHFRAFDGEEPVDIYLAQLEATLTNLTNIHDEVTPLVTTIEATARAMDQAPFEFQMKLDPFSYRPTFHLIVRLLGLDVTKLNAFARAYGAFDFERGFFDLVVEIDATEGMLEGYVKPLFRDLRVLSLRDDLGEDNALQVFWEALVGGAQALLKNQPRDQFGTLIPFRGEATGPEVDYLAVIANVLRNAFIRAYLPNVPSEGQPEAEGLQFGPASPIEEGVPVGAAS